MTRNAENDGSLKRAGLFGGTFDPIHLGHLQVARDVKERFLLGKIIFIPSAQPPHKTSRIIADAKDRIEMTRLAVSNCPDFSISDIELTRTGPSYTIDTMSYFQRTSPPDTQLFFILGIDAFLEIETWKSYRALFDQMPFIVMSRPGVDTPGKKENWQIVKTYLQHKISEGYRYDKSELCFVHREKCPVYLYEVTPVNISSTQIRSHIWAGIPIGDLVTKDVERYIKAQGLYR